MEKLNTKKRGNQELVPLISDQVQPKTLHRIMTCGDKLFLIADKSEEKKKMIGGHTCGNRFCPMCSWRKAKKDAMIIAVLMRYIEQKFDKIFLFITLTTPNVYGADLKAEIAKINHAHKKLMLRKELVAVNKGYIRKLEVTYDGHQYITDEMWNGNPQKHMKPRAAYYQRLGLKVGDKNPNYDTYHPHLHDVMAVNKSYFKSKDYINQVELLNMWRDVMVDDTITQVSIKRAGKKDGELVKSCVNEISKYVAKSEEYMWNKAVFDVFYTALKGAQVVTYNGLFKDAMALYKAKQLDAYKLVDPTEYFWLLAKQWNIEKYIDQNGEVFEPDQYIETERREMTDSEKLRFNFRAVGAMDDLTDD